MDGTALVTNGRQDEVVIVPSVPIPRPQPASLSLVRNGVTNASSSVPSPTDRGESNFLFFPLGI